MVSNLIFHSGRFFILPVPAVAFYDLGGVCGALAERVLEELLNSYFCGDFGFL